MMARASVTVVRPANSHGIWTFAWLFVTAKSGAAYAPANCMERPEIIVGMQQRCSDHAGGAPDGIQQTEQIKPSLEMNTTLRSSLALVSALGIFAALTGCHTPAGKLN